MVNQIFKLVNSGAGAATLQCPSMLVPKGATVRVYANNGTQAGNVNAIYIGQYAEQGSDGEAMANGQEKIFPVIDTGHIFVYLQAGDGAQISIKG